VASRVTATSSIPRGIGLDSSEPPLPRSASLAGDGNVPRSVHK
jgi:hypothetical protein